MSLSESDIHKVAHLARLSLTDAEALGYANQLSSILHYVEQMSAVQTDSIEPLTHPVEMPQRLRPDVVSESNQRDAFQAIAPAVEAGLYLVPKVIANES